MKLLGVVLCVLLLAGCAEQRVCPLYRIDDGLTVDAGAYVDAHRQAWKLCVNGTSCLALHTGRREPAVVRLSAEPLGNRPVSIVVTTRDGADLLAAETQVPVRHVVFDARCGIAADLGSVSITADGALKVA